MPGASGVSAPKSQNKIEEMVTVLGLLEDAVYGMEATIHELQHGDAPRTKDDTGDQSNVLSFQERWIALPVVISNFTNRINETRSQLTDIIF